MPETYLKTIDESVRAAALQHAELVNAPADESFDRITRVAKKVLGVSAAAVSVPVEGCSFLKSCIGYPESLTSTRVAPAPEGSFCHEVVRTGQPVIVEDASEPTLERPYSLGGIGFRSYAGIPLINSEGVALASFCVLDEKTRVWKEDEIETLRDLAAAIMTEIEMRATVRAATQTESLLAGQKRVLEMIARAAPLQETLTEVADLINNQATGVHCSILLLRKNTLLRGAAPNLPEAFNCSVHQLPINPAIGPCGLAAQGGCAVISSDLVNDSRWSSEFRALASEHGLQSCWSTPIFGTDNSVLGTFAMYYRESREPGQVEQRLIDVATHLAGIAIERARAEDALRQRAEQLAQADRRKDEFLSVLAHELRNPLAAVRTALQLQQRRAERRPSQMDEIIERQVLHLARLADDLLDVSRITRGKIELRPDRLDMRQLLREVIEDYSADVDAKGHELRLELPKQPLHVNGDGTRLAQVVANVLHNAIKFTDNGGRISVRLYQQNEHVALTVEDTGVGMTPDVVRHVFDPFTQVEQSLARSRGGLGLGLSLVASLIEMHGGKVSAESDGVNRGSRFHIRLPLAPAVQADNAYDADEEAAYSDGLRVLVIEDNQDTALTLRELLIMDGHQVRVAHTGPAGVEEAIAFRPDAVVCDLGLPGMDGYAVASALRNHSATASTKLIAFSGYGQPEDRQRSREHGFDLHLTKAGDPAELERALASVVDETSASPMR